MGELKSFQFSDRVERHFPSDYELKDGIFFPREGSKEAFAYNDGDKTEEYLLQRILSAENRSLSSGEILSAVHNWPTLYHLSPMRANLLRPFASFLQKRVLEVGAGCGAITRFLGENGGDIVAVEGSARRARIARARVSGLENVQVVCDRIEDFASEKKFDVITVIGVLEYAAIYNKKGSHADLLRRLRDLLAPQGVIILAIENKLGLKYFAGAREDHTGIPFDGINDAYRTGSVATFGTEELSALLDQSALPSHAWFYPSPDYKLPTTVLSGRAVDRYPALASALLAQMSYADPQRPADPTFSLEQSWRVLGQNNLLGSLANSFLVVAGAAADAIAPYAKRKAIAWHFTVNRHPAFAKETRFVEVGDELLVERRQLEALAPPIVPVRQLLEREPFWPGQNWWNELVAVLNKRGWSVADIADWARVWIDALLEECEIEALDGGTFSKHVDGRHFDLAPFNLIRDESGQARFFDREWCVKPSIELGYIIVRGLRDSLRRISSCAPADASTPYGVNQLVSGVLAELGVLLARSDIDRYVMMERQVQAWVQGRNEAKSSADSVSSEWDLHLKPRLPVERQALAREHESRQADVRRLRDEIEESEGKRRGLSAELEQQRTKEGELQRQIEVLSGTLAQQDRESASLGLALRDAEAKRLALEAELDKARKDALAQAEQRRAEIARLEGASTERSREIETLARLLKETRDNTEKQERLAETALARAKDVEEKEKRQADEIARLEANVADRFTELATLSGLIKAKEEEAEKSRSAASAAFARVADLEVRAQRQAAEIAQLEASIAERFAELATMSSLVKAKDEEAEKHRSATAAALARVAELEARAAHQAGEIAGLEENVAERFGELATLSGLLKAKEEEVDLADASVKGLGAQLAAIQDSIAWKATSRLVQALKPVGSVRRQLKLQRKLVQASGLFDASWYLTQNPDVAADGADPLDHFLLFGGQEGRNPSEAFDSKAYLRTHADVAEAGMNPLVHYLVYGRAERRIITSP